MTDEDVGYKPRIVEKASFKNAHLDKVFNKGLDKSYTKEGILKTLGNGKDVNEKQLQKIRDEH